MKIEYDNSGYLLWGMADGIDLAGSDLLVRLREQRGTALVLISHDLPLIADRTDTVTVLDVGRIVECDPTGSVFTAPGHAVTRALLRIPAGMT